MTETTRTIVINSIPYGESDLIITFFSCEYGLLKGMAKGARKSRKRFGGCFEPFSLLDLGVRIKDSGMLARVDSADLIDARLGIREDLDRINQGARMLELVSIFEPAGPPATKPFNLLDETLSQLEKSSNPAGLCASFFVKYLEISGFGIPISREGFRGEGRTSLCRGSLAFICQAGSIEVSKMGRLTLSAGAEREVFNFLRDYVVQISGKCLKSLDIAD